MSVSAFIFVVVLIGLYELGCHFFGARINRDKIPKERVVDSITVIRSICNEYKVSDEAYQCILDELRLLYDSGKKRNKG